MTTQLVYFEMPAKDTGRARTFYGELLGWSFDSSDGIDYHLVRDTTPPAALSAGDGADPTIYFGVEDLDASLAAVGALGGSHEQPQEIPGVGAILVLSILTPPDDDQRSIPDPVGESTGDRSDQQPR